jgi:Flp pilus assembly protein CpaB
MSREYFGHSPVRNYTVKLRWLVGALTGVVALLTLLLAVVLHSSSQPAITAQNDPGAAWAASSNLREILISRARIEHGMEIDGSYLSTTAVSEANLPEGYILASRKSEVIGRYAKQMIPPGAFLQNDLVSNEPLVSSETIPAGMRAVTVTVDSRAGVAGHVKPFSRVDVLCTYESKGMKEIGVVVPYAKVFSVNGMTTPSGQAGGAQQESNSVTLIVKEDDALRIELARTVGALSLNLVGNTTEIPTLRSTSPISQKQLFHEAGPVEIESVKILGRMTMRSPRDGKLVTFLLTEKGWQDEREINTHKSEPVA